METLNDLGVLMGGLGLLLLGVAALWGISEWKDRDSSD